MPPTCDGQSPFCLAQVVKRRPINIINIILSSFFTFLIYWYDLQRTPSNKVQMRVAMIVQLIPVRRRSNIAVSELA